MKLMGHTGGRRNGGGSPMGRVYRETTPAMLARVTAALDERIARALGVAGNPLRDAERSAGSSSWIAPAPLLASSVYCLPSRVNLPLVIRLAYQPSGVQ
jgi:hypothetical protein